MELEDPQDRLTCYDTTLGRTPTGRSADELLPGERAGGEAELQAEAERPEPSALARRWELVAQSDRGPFVITPYRPTYILPLSYQFSPDRRGIIERDSGGGDNVELKYQISLKAKVWPDLFSRRGDLWLAYTQQSYWQAYDGGASRPFRETNYEPELIYSYRTDFDLFGLYGRVVTLGLSHMSNGRSDPLSRSWNRLTTGVLFDNGDLAVSARGWWRIPEAASEDDNPDIVDYYGHGELRGHYRDGPNTYTVTLRSNLGIDAPLRGAVQLDYTRPIGGGLKGYLQLFHGYGESLIGYDHEATRLSLGVMVIDWL
ncbi:phospholipase A [Arhodomonas sp. SL1]|uniref:phospholipase A n=1 Tax=Arhodomonas sp. SL1 TaxID=3425691 RepID=UPI003F883DF8